MICAFSPFDEHGIFVLAKGKHVIYDGFCVCHPFTLLSYSTLFCVFLSEKNTVLTQQQNTHIANKRKVMAPIFNFLLHRRLVLKKGDRKLRCPQKKRRRENITARRET